MAAITLSESAGQVDLTSIAEHLRKQLPAYAVPLFLRIRSEHEVTSTFKSRRVELRDEGYDTSDEAIHILPAGETSYIPLDETLRTQLEAGEIRL